MQEIPVEKYSSYIHPFTDKKPFKRISNLEEFYSERREIEPIQNYNFIRDSSLEPISKEKFSPYSSRGSSKIIDMTLPDAIIIPSTLSSSRKLRKTWTPLIFGLCMLGAMATAKPQFHDDTYCEKPRREPDIFDFKPRRNRDRETIRRPWDSDDPFLH